VTVIGAQGYQQSLIASQTFSGLQPGVYTVLGAEVSANEDRYAAASASQSIIVSAGATPAAIDVAYVPITGRLFISIAGVPAGASAAVTVSGPGGYARALGASATLGGLAPGNYIVQAPSFSSAGDRYDAEFATQEIAIVAAPATPAQASVTYALASGRLAVTVSGLPEGLAAAVQVQGPGGFSRALSATETLLGLAPGAYTISAATIQSGSNSYAGSPLPSTVSVVAALVPAVAQVSYTLASGALQLVVTGLPVGVNANLTVTGPQGFSATVTGATVLAGLLPGNYSIAAGSAASGPQTWIPSPALQQVDLPASLTAELRTVGYTLGVGSLAVTVSGLPGGTGASVTVAGPGGFSQNLSASGTFTSLLPGNYTVTASAVTSNGTVYEPTPATRNVSVTIGVSASAPVTYSASTGALAISIGGLPGGASAAVSVSGPGGFSQALTASQTLAGLVPGNYTVTASNVTSGAGTYAPVPLSQVRTVTPGATVTATVTYSVSAGGATLDLTVNGVYLTQATQKFDGSVPLVAGRDAYLRVFALANQFNTAQPTVRVRLYNGAVLLQTWTIIAPAASVPTAVDEGSLSASWNVLVPGALVQPGLKVLADVDPSGATAESDEANNLFPFSGAPAAVDVRSLPTYAVRMVPVLQQVNGLQGNVSDANKGAFLTDLKARLPVGASDADVRAVYTTTAPALVSDNANGAWGTILSEVLALRSTDASTRYYYGVVKASYSSGVAGIGYVGGSARTAIGWDRLPSGASVMAHEVGHNMGRSHAPCGGPASPDPLYPYSNAQIGVWGLDVSTFTLKAPTLSDLMSYCHPDWISDYNWSAMLAYREGGPNNAPPMGGASGSGLLIWGRISDAGVVLEPAFPVAAAADHVPRSGANRLDLLAVDGSLLGTIPFDAPEVADLPSGVERHFAFVIPMDLGLQRTLAGLRVHSGGRSATRSAGPATGDPAPVLTRPNAQQVELNWDGTRYPVVMVRDATTGQVLSFARGGSVRLWTRSAAFRLIFSDGVRSVERPGRVLQ
jgi:hypothetical protein